MLNPMEQPIRFPLPTQILDENFELSPSHRPNLTVYFTETETDDVSRVQDPEYEQFLADVWVGIVLTLMVLSCVCCMCSCLLYHKFQQWKRNIEARRRTNNIEAGQADTESLPSYTIVSGLPSYDEAIEQLRKFQNQSKQEISSISSTVKPLERQISSEPWVPQTPPPPVARLSVTELFNLYKSSAQPQIDLKT